MAKNSLNRVKKKIRKNCFQQNGVQSYVAEAGLLSIKKITLLVARHRKSLLGIQPDTACTHDRRREIIYRKYFSYTWACPRPYTSQAPLYPPRADP